MRNFPGFTNREAVQVAGNRMIPLNEAYRIIDSATKDLTREKEVIPLRKGIGRILASPAVSNCDLPPFNKSAVDGYAVMAGDNREYYNVSGRTLAGHTEAHPLTPGNAVKVMTGASVPENAGRVIMLEDACEENGGIRIKNLRRASNICKKGEDMRAGRIVLPEGRKITPLAIASLASCGVTEIMVAKKIKAAIISTGDELNDGTRDLPPGSIYDSNGPLLASLADRFEFDIVQETKTRDSAAAIRRKIDRALSSAEMVFISGGMSAGDSDFVPQAICELGLLLHFTRVSVKPGKPSGFASGDGKFVFGLPGNPVAVYLMFHLFALRAAANLLSFKASRFDRNVIVARNITRDTANRACFIPARMKQDGRVAPVPYHGSAHLCALLKADGFDFIPAGVHKETSNSSIKYY